MESSQERGKRGKEEGERGVRLGVQLGRHGEGLIWRRAAGHLSVRACCCSLLRAAVGEKEGGGRRKREEKKRKKKKKNIKKYEKISKLQNFGGEK
jgi:hypothetical protein